MPDREALAWAQLNQSVRPNLPEGVPCRHFRIGQHEWTVCEDQGAAPLRSPALVFYGPGIARRVRIYPATWQDLPEEELYALSWGR